MLLKECKHIEKEIKVIRYITDGLTFPCDDLDESGKKQIKTKQHDGCSSEK